MPPRRLRQTGRPPGRGGSKLSLLVIGLDHRTAPVDLRERLSVERPQLPHALAQLADYVPQSADRDDDFIGYRAEVVSGFDETSAGVGRVSYRGAQWDARSAEGEKFASGDPVKIIGREGAVLIIERG